MKSDTTALSVGRIIVRFFIVICVIASVAKCYYVLVYSQDFEVLVNEDGLPTLDE
jgi:hypothetical protein